MTRVNFLDIACIEEKEIHRLYYEEIITVSGNCFRR